MSTATYDPKRGGELAALTEVWGFLLAMGIALMAVGLAAIGSSFVATFATVVVFGIQLILGGIFQVVASFWARCWRGFFLHLLGGVLSLIAGVLLIDQPLAAALALTLVIAVALLVGGLLRVLLAVIERFEGWGLMAFGGAVSILLGVSIWKQWPLSGLWVIGLFVGVEFLFSGVSWVSLALAARAAGRPPVPGPGVTA